MRTGPGVHFLDAAAPEGMRLYAIGDVHGRYDLLKEMHARIRGEIMRDRPADWRIIHVGDYVDRGPQSREVIELLLELTRSDPHVVALAGNHDIGFVDFLRRPTAVSLFAHNGGEQTARSYGVEVDLSTDASTRRAADAMLAVIPSEQLTFLHDLPRSCSFGDFFFCHAGVKPGVALDAQNPEDLIWIRGEFHRWPELYEKVVVHGHTPAAVPEIVGNRVNLDTGAWQSGILTALAVDGQDKRIMQVER